MRLSTAGNGTNFMNMFLKFMHIIPFTDVRYNLGLQLADFTQILSYKIKARRLSLAADLCLIPFEKPNWLLLQLILFLTFLTIPVSRTTLYN